MDQGALQIDLGRLLPILRWEEMLQSQDYYRRPALADAAPKHEESAVAIPRTRSSRLSATIMHSQQWSDRSLKADRMRQQ